MSGRQLIHQAQSLCGRLAVGDGAQGCLVFSDIPLSFWGGVDPQTGIVIDHHHPLHGESIADRILAIPGARGSCTGSGVIIELLTNGCAPAGIILATADEIIILAVVLAQVLYGISIPVVCLDADGFARVAGSEMARIDGNVVQLFAEIPEDDWQAKPAPEFQSQLDLTDRDRAMADGEFGAATAIAMAILIRMASVQDAPSLIDVGQVHIDSCIYTGPASLRLAQSFVELGGKVRIPTTLNAISVDRRRWREIGVDDQFAVPSDALAQAFLDMGASPTFTCAPYLLDTAPRRGEQIGWAESNAVVFANSVIGARTQKYPDFLDLCIALTGRAPCTGAHLETGRAATTLVEVELPDNFDDAFWPLLGHLVGELCPAEIAAIVGLEMTTPSLDDFKAFGAAFATTSAAPLFHIVGCTPEAATVDEALAGKAPARICHVTKTDLKAAWRDLDSASRYEIQLISLGNPHLSLTECRKIAELCRGRKCHPETRMVLTMGRAVEAAAREAGYLSDIESFGATSLTDTCWCMIGEPIVSPECQCLITNSAKFAHYAPGLVNCEVQFGSLASCIDAACAGRRRPQPPRWLSE